MKKFGFIALLSIVMLTFSSCSKDKSELIIGKWSITADSYYRIEYANLDPYMDYTTEGSYKWSFAEDGNMTQEYSNGTVREGTYAIDGNTLIVDNVVNIPSRNSTAMS